MRRCAGPLTASAPVGADDAAGEPFQTADQRARSHDPDRERKLVAVAESTLEPSRGPEGQRSTRDEREAHDGWERPEDPPAPVEETAESFLRDRLGAAREIVTRNASFRMSADAFCGEWGTDACDRLGYVEAWRLEYHVRVRDRALDASIFVLDDGRLVTIDLRGFPDCAARPDECRFPVSAEDATRVAREAGLGEGVAAWTTELSWHQTYRWPEGALIPVQPDIYGTYAWSVRNHTTSESGHAYVVDANSGALLLRDQWANVWLARSGTAALQSS